MLVSEKSLVNNNTPINNPEELIERFTKRVNVMIQDYIDSNSLYTPREPVELYEFAKKRVYEGGGKRLRPALALAAYEAFSDEEDTKLVVPWMFFVEALHSGYLDIDDVMDESPLRHNQPTTNKILTEKHGKKGSSLATLVGMKNSEAMTTFALYDGHRLWQSDIYSDIFWMSSRIRQDTIDGQYDDILFRKNPSLTKENQLVIYIGKTGSYTTAGPMAGGARIGGVDKRTMEDIFEAGKTKIGPAFQIRDDVLNLLELEQARKDSNYKGRYGKEPGDDLKEGKPTLPVAHFNEVASEADKNKFHEKFGDPLLTMDERIELYDLLKRYNTIEMADNESKTRLSDGLASIRQLIPESEKSRNFYNLVNFSVNRRW